MTPPAEPPAWTVTVDPRTFAIGIAHVQVERALGPRVSVYAGPSLRCFDGILPATNGPWTAYGAEVGVRGFFTGRAPEGAWGMVRGVLAAASTRDAPAAVNPAGRWSATPPSSVRASCCPAARACPGSTTGPEVSGCTAWPRAAHTNVGWAF